MHQGTVGTITASRLRQMASASPLPTRRHSAAARANSRTASSAALIQRMVRTVATHSSGRNTT